MFDSRLTTSARLAAHARFEAWLAETLHAQLIPAPE
jgi:hypothetical protein